MQKGCAEMNKTDIENEIKKNEEVILELLKINKKLLQRYEKPENSRCEKKSYDEYNNFWHDFWEKKEYFRKDLPIVNNGVVIQGLTPFEFKKKVIIDELRQKIEILQPRVVLEIGSGGGLNLMLLAPEFPNISFIGLEPTQSGVDITNKMILEPPAEFEKAFHNKAVHNIEIIQGSILDKRVIESMPKDIDLIFTSAVLEQLNNNINEAFAGISLLKFTHFLFYEEWLEANSDIKHYKTLVESDYFRQSTRILNEFNLILKEFKIPILQPSWMQYGIAFGVKNEF